MNLTDTLCAPCLDAHCSNCSSNYLVCVDCTIGYHILNGSCAVACGDNITAGLEECDDGNNVDGDGCNADCTIGNNNGCPATSPYRDPLTNLCSNTCPNPYFQNASVYECSACYYTCASCSGSPACDSCNASNNRFLNGTLCQPMPGYYDNSSFIAIPCVSPCVNCLSLIVCLTCVNGYYLDLNNSCQPCTAILNCDTCDLINATLKCTSCIGNFTPDANATSCILVGPCTDPNCGACPANFSVCMMCNAGYLISPNYTCVADCGDGIVASL